MSENLRQFLETEAAKGRQERPPSRLARYLIGVDDGGGKLRHKTPDDPGKSPDGDKPTPQTPKPRRKKNLGYTP